MAERHRGDRPAVVHAYAFDRLFNTKLQNAYSVLVPEHTCKIPAQRQDVGVQDEGCSPVCPRVKRAAKRN